MRGKIDGIPFHEVALEAMPEILGCHRPILCQHEGRRDLKLTLTDSGYFAAC
jgi:hypothetical protein